jgi:hypothetical protein
MSRVFTSAAAKDEARLMAVVVLPTPPFWLATAMTRPIGFFGDREQTQNSPNQSAIAMTDLGAEEWLVHFVDEQASRSEAAAILHTVPRGPHRRFCTSVPRGTFVQNCIVFHMERCVHSLNRRNVPRGTPVENFELAGGMQAVSHLDGILRRFCHCLSQKRY